MQAHRLRVAHLLVSLPTHTFVSYRHLLNIVPETAPQACVPPDHPAKEENILYLSKNGILGSLFL